MQVKESLSFSLLGFSCKKYEIVPWSYAFMGALRTFWGHFVKVKT